LKVLSLFDGISCGQLALKNLGITPEKYFASEIDKYAISICKYNFPNTIHLGDVLNWKDWITQIDFCEIDLIIGGNPCTSWSLAGKQDGPEAEKGRLLFTMVEIFKYAKEKNPDLIFLFENVKMKKEFLFIFNQAIGSRPTLIDSGLVSAQNRKRYYWTNLNENIPLPKDKNVLLKDILVSEFDEKYFLSKEAEKSFERKKETHKHTGFTKINIRELEGKATTLTARYAKRAITDNYILTLASLSHKRRKDIVKNKLPLSHSEDLIIIPKPNQYIRTLHLGQNGSLFNDKVPTLTCSDTPSVVTDEMKIRMLTPLECERLQTLPDNYTAIGILNGKEILISDSQRYKAVGNGWTVAVISHIFLNILPEDFFF